MNKKRQNTKSLPAILMISSIVLICATILVRDVYPVAVDGRKILGPSQANNIHIPQEKTVHTAKKADNPRYSINIAPDVAKLFQAIIKIEPEATKVVMAVEMTGYYDITLVGLDLTMNRFHPEISVEKYIMELTMVYDDSSFHQWNFTGKMDLEFKGVFLNEGSKLKLRYVAPKIHTGCIGMNLVGGMKSGIL